MPQYYITEKSPKFGWCLDEIGEMSFSDLCELRYERNEHGDGLKIIAIDSDGDVTVLDAREVYEEGRDDANAARAWAKHCNPDPSAWGRI
jgi:hypothetical protein